MWRAETVLTGPPRVTGSLFAAHGRQPLDLLAVDAAYPRVVCTPDQRHDAHQAWHFGEVLMLTDDKRAIAGVPAVEFDPDLVVEAIRRVAKAIGAPPGNLTVELTL